MSVSVSVSVSVYVCMCTNHIMSVKTSPCVCVFTIQVFKEMENESVGMNGINIKS